MKTLTKVAFKAGLANLWLGSVLIAFTPLVEFGVTLGACGAALLALAILGTLACGVKALVSSAE